MPQAIAIAAITAGAQMGGAALQSRSANKAASAQERATREALALERERDAAAARRAEAAQARYDQQYAAWYEAKRQVLARHGINVPALEQKAQAQSRGGTRGPTTFAPGLDGAAPPAGALPPGATDTGMGKLPAGGGVPLGQMMGAPGGGGGGSFNLMDSQQAPSGRMSDAAMPTTLDRGPEMASEGLSLGDMMGASKWSDWRKYAAG